MRWCIYFTMLLCLLARWSLLIHSKHVTTRSLGKFARMIKALTGRGPLEYNQYGNYCGFGGTGEPVDDIDRCCAAHDDCYTQLQGRGCVPYFSPYEVNITGPVVRCASTGQFCLDEACRCDEVAARCFSRHEYNPVNKRRFRLLSDFGQS